jgi:hypothetical protein
MQMVVVPWDIKENIMAKQKEHNPGQKPGGSGRDDQEKRPDQANPGPQGGDRDREQKSGQGGRESPPDQARPDKPEPDPDRSKQDKKSSG